MPTWGSISFQDANSPNIEFILFLNDHIIVILLIVLILVFYQIVIFKISSFNQLSSKENQEIEIAWTRIPAITLIAIATPSLKSLYLIEELTSPSLSIKITGSQWYWTYRNLFHPSNSSFISSHLPRLNIPRTSLNIPINTQIRLLITSTDVIHSWAIPSLRVKTDANPGRINQSSILIKRPGLLVGQCSEICGANHSFIPISIKAFRA